MAVILQGEIIQGKPKMCVSYFFMKNQYLKVQDNISMSHTHTHTHARTHARTYARTHTDKPKPICPYFSKVGGIILQLYFNHQEEEEIPHALLSQHILIYFICWLSVERSLPLCANCIYLLASILQYFDLVHDAETALYLPSC